MSKARYNITNIDQHERIHIRDVDDPGQLLTDSTGHCSISWFICWLA